MANEKVKLGKVGCRCKRETLYLEVNTKTQTIGFKCPECGLSGYTKKGEEAHKAFLAECGPAPEPTPAPAPAPTPAPAPNPAPITRRTPEPFDLKF